MTVAELRSLLEDAPDDMEVFIGGSDDVLGMFSFIPACSCDTGVIDIEPPTEGEIGEGDVVFAIFPHGLGVAEDDLDDIEEDKTYLN